MNNNNIKKFEELLNRTSFETSRNMKTKYNLENPELNINYINYPEINYEIIEDYKYRDDIKNKEIKVSKESKENMNNTEIKQYAIEEGKDKEDGKVGEDIKLNTKTFASNNMNININQITNHSTDGTTDVVSIGSSTRTGMKKLQEVNNTTYNK